MGGSVTQLGGGVRFVPTGSTRDEWRSPCRAALRLAVGTEGFERADEELVEYFLDIPVDADRSRLAEFVLAESAGFYDDTADPCGPGPLDIPDGVADRDRPTRIDREGSHGSQEDLRRRLRVLDDVRGGLPVDGVISVQHVAQDLELVRGR
jgi:hypothetical protein